VEVVRAELVRSHRPVVVSEVPVYVALKDRDGRFFEDKGNCPHVRYRWLRGPVIKPCIFHPHKTSQFRDVTKTYQYYCSKECFMRGWHQLPRNQWLPRPEGSSSSRAVAAGPPEEPPPEWVEVALTRKYCPTAADIDRPLRLDIIPILKDGGDASVGMLSVTTGTVIPTPKEARTRRMISNGGTFNAEWLSKQFKIMNWNVLADLYATESIFPYCEKWALSWAWRKHLILKELKSMTADVITLQEVQKDAFDEWFKPELEEAGYDGVFQSKRREPVFHRGRYTSEGCATFWKTSRFQKIDKQLIDYDKLSERQVRCLPNPQDAERGLQRASRGNIALAVILEDLQIKPTQVGQAVGPNGGHLLAVVNTHILADPGLTDVKLWQSYLLLQSLEQSLTKDTPMLICGDFNSTPDSAVYDYLRHGVMSGEHAEFNLDPCGLLECLTMGHSLQLSTAYDACNGREAEFTNYTEEFKGTLDYIFFSGETLDVLAVSQVDDEQQLTQETALPSSTRPSDHVSLVATFLFKEAPGDGQVQGPSSLVGGGYGSVAAASVVSGGGDALFAAGAQAYVQAAGGYPVGPWC